MKKNKKYLSQQQFCCAEITSHFTKLGYTLLMILVCMTGSITYKFFQKIKSWKIFAIQSIACVLMVFYILPANSQANLTADWNGPATTLIQEEVDGFQSYSAPAGVIGYDNAAFQAESIRFQAKQFFTETPNDVATSSPNFVRLLAGTSMNVEVDWGTFRLESDACSLIFTSSCRANIAVSFTPNSSVIEGVVLNTNKTAKVQLDVSFFARLATGQETTATAAISIEYSDQDLIGLRRVNTLPDEIHAEGNSATYGDHVFELKFPQSARELITSSQQIDSETATTVNSVYDGSRTYTFTHSYGSWTFSTREYCSVRTQGYRCRTIRFLPNDNAINTSSAGKTIVSELEYELEVGGEVVETQTLTITVHGTPTLSVSLSSNSDNRITIEGNTATIIPDDNSFQSPYVEGTISPLINSNFQLELVAKENGRSYISTSG